MLKDDVFRLFPETLVIGSGITAIIPAVPFQNGIALKYGEGGSLVILGNTLVLNNIPYGSTYAASKGYLMGTTEIFSADLCGPLALFAGGATTTCYLTRTLSAGPTLGI
jgi:hypothetical protein